MFGINASLLFAAILYTLWRLKWRTTESQQPIPNNCFGDFFDCDHVVQSVNAVVRKRSGNRRMYLVILFIAMALYTFQRGQSKLYYSINSCEIRKSFVCIHTGTREDEHHFCTLKHQNACHYTKTNNYDFTVPFSFVQMRSQCHTSIPSCSSNGQLKCTVTTGLSKMHHMLLVCKYNLIP
jgi:hypothetical protein